MNYIYETTFPWEPDEEVGLGATLGMTTELVAVPDSNGEWETEARFELLVVRPRRRRTVSWEVLAGDTDERLVMGESSSVPAAKKAAEHAARQAAELIAGRRVFDATNRMLAEIATRAAADAIRKRRDKK